MKFSQHRIASPALQRLTAGLAAFCLLALSGLAQDPLSRPDPGFRKDLKRLAGYADAGDGRKVAELLKTIQPVGRIDAIDLMMPTGLALGTVAATLGPDEALRLLDQFETRIKLPDPAAVGRDYVAAENELSSLTPEEKEIFSFRNTTGMSSEEKAAFYAKKAAQKMGEARRNLYLLTRAKLLDAAGRRDQAIALLEKALQAPDFDSVDEDFVRTALTQYQMVDVPAPMLQVDQAFGTFSGLETLRGKVVLVEFTAHWCGPCLKAVPHLINVYNKYHAQGFEAVAVTGVYGYFGAKKKIPREEEMNSLRGLIAEMRIPWPMVVGPQANFSAYKVRGIPHVYLLDKKGVIRRFWIGAQNGFEQTLGQTIEKLLQEPVAQDGPGKPASLGQ